MREGYPPKTWASTEDMLEISGKNASRLQWESMVGHFKPPNWKTQTTRKQSARHSWASSVPKNPPTTPMSIV
jgi:hypothetical protein